MMDFTSIFLQALAVDSGDAPPLVLLVAMIAALGIFVFLVLLLAVYIYLSFAYSAIGRRAKVRSPGIAWFPFLGPLIIAYRSSRMHWWPWLLLIGMVIPFINIFANLAFFVVSIIWHWKMFESVKRPGWWAILNVIPIVNFIVIGMAAWGKTHKK